LLGYNIKLDAWGVYGEGRMMNGNIGTEEILKSAQSFMECKILQSGAELNLFTILDEAPQTAGEVAARIHGDPRALALLLNALAAMGLLTKKGQTYACDEPFARHLSERSPRSLLPMIRHMASLWARWSNLTDIVRGGGGAKQNFEFSRNPGELESFIAAMHVVAMPMAQQIVASVNAGGARALLDVGSGSGTYSIAFLRAIPEMKATLLDVPEVIEMARRRLQDENLLGRATLIEGSFHEQELPHGHDLGLLSAIIHSNSPEQNLDLYKKVYRALNPGGRVLIRDYIMNSDRTFPREGAVFAINMLVGTPGGRTYSFDEIKEALKEAGFSEIRILQEGEHQDAVVEGFKP
jgi:3-hydroxy-5-methyl-1-naphthoate 3-O-methyltransferase